MCSLDKFWEYDYAWEQTQQDHERTPEDQARRS